MVSDDVPRNSLLFSYRVMCIFLMASLRFFFLFFLRFYYECFNVFVFVSTYPHWFSDLWFALLLILQSSQTLLLQIFLLFHPLSSYSVSVMCMLHLLMFHNSWMFYFFLSFSPLYTFYFERFLLIVFKFTDSFLACVESTDLEPLEEILISISVFDFSII